MTAKHYQIFWLSHIKFKDSRSIEHGLVPIKAQFIRTDGWPLLPCIYWVSVPT